MHFLLLPIKHTNVHTTNTSVSLPVSATLQNVNNGNNNVIATTSTSTTRSPSSPGTQDISKRTTIKPIIRPITSTTTTTTTRIHRNVTKSPPSTPTTSTMSQAVTSAPSVNVTTTGTPSTSTPSPPVSSTLNPTLNAVTSKISLYTRRNPIAGQYLVPAVPQTVIDAVTFDANKPTRILIHGSFDGADVGHWMRDMKHRLIDVDDSNVILVDWSNHAANSNAAYRLSAVRIVGNQVAVIIQDFVVSRKTRK